MKLFKISSLLPLAVGSMMPISANEYQFDNIKYDQIENNQNIYEPKDKLDKYIIDASIYATKFVPLMNSEANENEYTNIITDDG